MSKSSEIRKNSLWSKEKIAKLIQLYKKHECLWNHYTEHYKSKERRNKAIEEICESLSICKFDFGKKIHNLRNQFNSEMKKLERRLEESGGGNASELSSAQKCRWEHFESLMFLRDIIEPRPGGYQSSYALQHQPKKIRLKLDYSSEEEQVASANAAVENESDTEYHIEETELEEITEAAVDEFQQNFDGVEKEESAETYDRKYNPSNGAAATVAPASSSVTIATTVPTSTTTTNKSYIARMYTKLPKTHPPEAQKPIEETLPSPLPPTGSIIELAPSHMTSPARLRDQWDSFGELIANEFRNLNSEASRRKLKRKIMQAMLEVGEEDDSGR